MLPGHNLGACARLGDKTCNVKDCRSRHSWLLHGSEKIEFINTLQIVSGTDGGAAGTLLLFQYVLVNNNQRAFVFFDNGSSASLITHKFAKKIGLQGRPIQIHLITVGNKKTSTLGGKCCRGNSTWDLTKIILSGIRLYQKN